LKCDKIISAEKAVKNMELAISIWPTPYMRGLPVVWKNG
jgi:hypothetical protein